jgi:cation-transporting ATPase 13A2
LSTSKFSEIGDVGFVFITFVIHLGLGETIPSTELVPGDVFSIPQEVSIMPCDAYLLRGDCIVDESALTGESVPVSKWPIMCNAEEGRRTSLDNDEGYLDFSSIKKISWLYLGTKVVRSRPDSKGKVLAIVRCTGFNTSKGKLFRSIVFPAPNKSKMYLDSFKFVAVMFVVSLGGMIYSIYTFASYGASWSDILIRIFDLFAAVIPQTLPATLSLGIEFALKRLSKNHIYCISPQK